jgi:hypothetical protein
VAAPVTARICLDFSETMPILGLMSNLLDQALESVLRLDPAAQDDIARVMKVLAGDDDGPVVSLTPEEREAIARSKAETARGEYATDEQVRAVWAKYGL